LITWNREFMKKRVLRISVGVFAGLVILTAVIWLLAKTLGNTQYPTLYAGKTTDYWQQQLYGHDAAASNAAFAVVSSQIIPQAVDTMFHDTNDSAIRLSLIKILNGLPGVQIYYIEADQRRAGATEGLGDIGPAAKSVLPDLIKALKGNDKAIREAAITSLGKIRSEPDTVIPLLIPYLEDDNFDVAAANALAEFGSLAKPAVPKLLPLLQAKDDDDQAAAQQALLKIDPEAAAKAGVKAKPAGRK
jgi:HEAT repeat protein